MFPSGWLDTVTLRQTPLGRHLSFNVLGRHGFASPPETDAANNRESEEDAVICQLAVRTLEDRGESSPKCDTQSPNRLHLKASGFGRTDPVVVVQHSPGLV
jgi:hypothetical protein